MKLRNPIEPAHKLFGARLQQVREALGLTQQDLAARVKLTRASIANIEGGNQRLLLHDVDRFASALGITPRNLLKGIWM